MGNDGGSIPVRCELVKEAKVKKVVKRKFDNTCDLTNEKLSPPIVICRLGYIFNKENIIKSLLDKSLPEKFSHIKGLKDIKNINEDCIKKTISNNHISDQFNYDNNAYKLICPFSFEEYTGNTNFVFLFKCGCLLNKKFLEEDFLKDIDTKITDRSLQSKLNSFNDLKLCEDNGKEGILNNSVKCCICGTINSKFDVIQMGLTAEELDEKKLILLEIKKNHNNNLKSKTNKKLLGNKIGKETNTKKI